MAMTDDEIFLHIRRIANENVKSAGNIEAVFPTRNGWDSLMMDDITAPWFCSKIIGCVSVINRRLNEFSIIDYFDTGRRYPLEDEELEEGEE